MKGPENFSSPKKENTDQSLENSAENWGLPKSTGGDGNKTEANNNVERDKLPEGFQLIKNEAIEIIKQAILLLENPEESTKTGVARIQEEIKRLEKLEHHKRALRLVESDGSDSVILEFSAKENWKNKQTSAAEGDTILAKSLVKKFLELTDIAYTKGN